MEMKNKTCSFPILMTLIDVKRSYVFGVHFQFEEPLVHSYECIHKSHKNP